MTEESERIALRDMDITALGEVFARYHDSMSLLLRPLAEDEHALDDLVRSVWLAAIADRDTMPEDGSPRAWLFSFVLRCFTVDTPDADERADDPFVPDGEPWAGHWQELPEPWPAGTESWLRSPAGCAAVQEYLAAADLADRLLLVLRDLDNWSPGDFMALTGWRPDVQRVALANARLALHTAIGAAAR